MLDDREQCLTVWITGDQCSFQNTALKAAQERISSVRVLMIESVARGNKLKYHKKKLVLIYSIMRHFAEELQAAGWQVDYYVEHENFQSAVQEHIEKYRPAQLYMMEQSEYGANHSLSSTFADKSRERLGHSVPVRIFEHCNFVSSADEFEKLHSSPSSRVTMDRFYRLMRKKTGLLMDGAEPVGSQWNYDKENRNPPGKDLVAAEIKRFPPDGITRAVIDMVERRFPDHPGTTEGWMYAVTRKDALQAAADFLENRLDHFGPHQDAMLHSQPFLNHSVLSPYLNTCLLHPLELCRDAEKRYIEKEARLSSVEGFIRQLIGWREFIWRVYWRMMPEYKARNALEADRPLPDFFWTGKTDMRCLSDALTTVIEHAYAHHIIRLMVLGNFALIAGLDPLQMNDWFASMFVDGYDWVMVPNVIGMTLHADGGYVGTKPYAASANYINKMSDFCAECRYDPKLAVGENACPFNSLYWNFLRRNQDRFASNHRMAIAMKALHAKGAANLDEMQERADALLASWS